MSTCVSVRASDEGVRECIFVYVIVHVCGSVRGHLNDLNEADAYISVYR